MSGPEAGIYAIAEVLQAPTVWENIPDNGYWIDPPQVKETPHCLIRFTTKMLHKPLLRADLKEDPVLSELSILRMAQKTNFPVTPEQWRRVFEIKEARC
jgi:predicted RNA-binding protein with PUA-like domain